MRGVDPHALQGFSRLSPFASLFVISWRPCAIAASRTEILVRTTPIRTQASPGPTIEKRISEFHVHHHRTRTREAQRSHHASPTPPIRFAGDSGDGMQVAGTQFSQTSALLGNDIATFPDFPAEIRALRDTLFGVSGFQVHSPPRYLHARRRSRRPGGDERRGTQDEPRRPPQGRHPDLQYRWLREEGPRRGQVRREPAQ